MAVNTGDFSQLRGGFSGNREGVGIGCIKRVQDEVRHAVQPSSTASFADQQGGAHSRMLNRQKRERGCARMEPMTTHFDRQHRIAVLGGGPGGYEAALAGAQLGADVTLIERVGVGGSAVLTDVVPSKTLIATAEAAGALRGATDLGVQFFVRGESGRAVKPEIAVNLAQVNKRVLRLAHEQSDDMREQLVAAGVRIISGEGRLDGPTRLVVATGHGTKRTDFDQCDADTIIVAVGASPRELASAQPDGERIFTWTQLYSLRDVPDHLIVVGSGVTGAEFASAYRALGAQVTLVSSRDQVLPGEDVDAAHLIETVFRRNGMTLLAKSRADSVVNTGDGVRVTLSDGTVIEGSHCLMAVGSIPNTAGIGLEEAGVQLTESGHVAVNKVARTSIPSVYAVGDCSDSMPLASVASMQGRTAVYHAMGDAVTPIKLRNVTSNIFTAPEIATVGFSQKQIEDGETRGFVFKLALESNARAKMQGITDGFIKLFAAKTSGTVIGGVVVAPRASELILPIALAIEHRLTVDQLARAYSVYPSLSSGITDAARAMHGTRD
jgi:dihydrolipoamide dehydrogenase